jgi:hypothetical protein
VHVQREILLWIGGFGLMVCLWILLVFGQMDLLCSLLILGVLLLSAVHNRGTAALLTLFFLSVLGDVRRIVAASFGQPPLDLLLLIGPVIAAILGFGALIRVRLSDGLAKAMFVLLGLMVLEVFNPMQGGISVGLSGALFYIAPVLWFWVGRQFASPALVERLLYRIVFPLSVLAAVLGLCQTFIGFLPYQQAWIEIASKSYVALYVGHFVRAFGFSVSSAEYAALLAIGAAGTAAAFFGRHRYWILATPLLIVAVVLASSRGVVIKVVMSLAVVLVLRRGGRLAIRQILSTGLLLAAGLVSIWAVASHMAPEEDTAAKSSAAASLIAHQTGGFAHPLDSRYSTAGIHSNMVLYGLTQGFEDPIGHGLGSTTLAATKFGGDPSVSSSEMDISDMFISLGFVGGLLYLYVVFASFRRAVQYLQEVETGISLPIVAILVSTITTWMIGGQYSTSSLICFLIGAIAYPNNPQVEPILQATNRSSSLHWMSPRAAMAPRRRLTRPWISTS